MEVLRVDQVETSLNTKDVIKRGFAIKTNYLPFRYLRAISFLSKTTSPLSLT